MSPTVRAVRWHAALDVRLDDIAMDAPGPGEVMVTVSFCGICGSDLHEILRGPHAIPVALPHPQSGTTAPIVLGHEFSGIVYAVGDDVHDVEVGDAVVVEPNYRCGFCDRCRAGDYHICASFGFAGLMGDGGLAQRTIVPAYMIHVLPSGFDLAAAAVLEPAAVALHAVRRSTISQGSSAAVIGLGPVGLLVGRLLQIRGASTVVGFDPDPSRRQAASEFGFDSVFESHRSTEHGSTSETLKMQPVDTAFEVVGMQSAFDTAVDVVRPGGEIILLGLIDQLKFESFEFVNSEKTIRASVGYNNCHRELIDLVEAGHLDLESLITRVVSLADAPAVLLGMAQDGAIGIKTLVRVQEDDHDQ